MTRGGTNTVVVPNSMCPQPPPPDRQYCNVLDCPVRWHTGEWSKCSKTCGGGLKQREVSIKYVIPFFSDKFMSPLSEPKGSNIKNYVRHLLFVSALRTDSLTYLMGNWLILKIRCNRCRTITSH